MHDDRIAGVTFEENTSRNALIVNEEYAWVGNSFSAQKVKGEEMVTGRPETVPYLVGYFFGYGADCFPFFLVLDDFLRGRTPIRAIL